MTSGAIPTPGGPSVTSVAIFAKAPVPGFAKTRLIPSLGPEGAAALQGAFIERAVATALASGIGPVTLWCAPGPDHPLFRRLAAEQGIALAGQGEGDLGERMLAAFESAGGPLVLIGTDCPVLAPADLQGAAAALAEGADAAISPAEDGGYGLIAAAKPWPALFRDMPWSTPEVARLTRARAGAAGLLLLDLPPIWDVDTPQDLARLQASGLMPDASLWRPRNT